MLSIKTGGGGRSRFSHIIKKFGGFFLGGYISIKKWGREEILISCLLDKQLLYQKTKKGKDLIYDCCKDRGNIRLNKTYLYVVHLMLALLNMEVINLLLLILLLVTKVSLQCCRLSPWRVLLVFFCEMCEVVVKVCTF